MLEISPGDAILKKLDFKPYRYTTKRSAKQYLPGEDQPQTISVKTPWGGVLRGEKGDYLVNEYGNPDNQWVVRQDLFEETYQELDQGIYHKKAIVELVPLTEITHDPDQEITIHSLEGSLTVRSGDFHLARGVEGKIWPAPNKEISKHLEQVE